MVTYNDGNAQPSDAAPPTYKIAAGDTFWSISQRFGLTVDQLVKANPGVDPTKLKVGQIINLIARQQGKTLFMSFVALPPSTYTIAAGDTFWTISQRFGLSIAQLEAANPGVDPTKLRVGEVIHLSAQPTGEAMCCMFLNAWLTMAGPDQDVASSGIFLSNKSNKSCHYYFYENFWNGNGTAGANFDKPSTNLLLAAGQTQFVKLPTSFKGRVQRGTLIPATWVEFQVEADNDHAAHGDISVEQGNDGGALIRSTDGRKSAAGFTGDILTWGRPEAYQTRSDGVRALASTAGNWMGGPNQAAIDAQLHRIGTTVYVVGGTGIPDVASNNKRFAVEFY